MTQLYGEVDLIRRLDHPNIVRLQEVFETEESLFLVMVSGYPALFFPEEIHLLQSQYKPLIALSYRLMGFGSCSHAVQWQ